MSAPVRSLAPVAVAFAMLAACAGPASRIMPDPITLPIVAEPDFQLARYDDLPSGTRMLVRWDTAGLVGRLMREMPALVSNRASISLVREQLIVSDGAYFRRIWFSFTDTATHSELGPCRQDIHLWFAPTGDLSGIYVDAQACPRGVNPQAIPTGTSP